MGAVVPAHMSIIATIKRLLGMDDGREQRSEDAAVTIEREAGEPATESESAVKRGTAGGVESNGATESSGSDDATGGASDTATAESGASDTAHADETAETSESSVAAEPAGATETDGTGETSDTGETADETSESADAEPADPAAGASVEEIKGIGPAYGDRLAEAGVETVADLRDGDPARLAEAVKVGESRVRRWIDRAREYE